SRPACCPTWPHPSARWRASTSSLSTRSRPPSTGARRRWPGCSRHEEKAMAVTFPPDLEIARKARLLPMPDIAAKMGIGPHLLEPYGCDVPPVRLEALAEPAERPTATHIG